MVQHVPTQVKHPLSALHRMATKKIIKQFATKYHLVYFGRVDAQNDEHALVRGMTAAATHTDNHYSVGSLQGHDITLVERRNTLIFPGKPESRYTWIILQVDLKREGLPHIIIDAHHHDEIFYANLLLTGKLENITTNLAPYDPQFAAICTVLTPQTAIAEALHVVPGAVSTTIATHFKQFDFEIDDDRVLIYASNVIVTPLLLNEMLRAGLWLAEQLNDSRRS